MKTYKGVKFFLFALHPGTFIRRHTVCPTPSYMNKAIKNIFKSINVNYKPKDAVTTLIHKITYNVFALLTL